MESSQYEVKKGQLFIVATPIGNLSDITYRAVETLKNVAFILAEDTRYTQKLLNHYEIKTSLVSYRDQNHESMMPKVLEKLEMGLDLALVSDSGTPLISDPGYRLVNQLKTKGYHVVPIPGPSALIASLSASGLPTDRFTFLGFLPKSESKRINVLEEIKQDKATVIIYESPNRLIELFDQIAKVYGANQLVCVASELTKVYEKLETGPLSEVRLKYENPRGEFIVLIAKSE